MSELRLILTLATKDLRILLRDRAGFFFTFFFPIVIATFFGSIFSSVGGPRSLPIALVDEDRTAASTAFVESLEATEAFRISSYADTAEAEDAVRKSQRVAAITIPKGYGDAAEAIWTSSPPTVHVLTDPARRAEAAMIEGVLLQLAAQRLRERLDSPELQRLAQMQLGDRASGTIGLDALASPLVVERHDVVVTPRGPRNGYAVSFPQGMIWGLLGCAAAFGISIAVERMQGTLSRLRSSPASATHILLGKALACFTTAFSLCVALTTLGVAVFGVRPDSYGLLALAFVCASLCFVGIMMLLSVVGTSQQAATGIGWSILIVLAMFGGGAVPLFLLPDWMQSASHWSPVKWAILAFEGAIWRDYSAAEMLLPCGILVGTGIVAFAAGVRVFRWSD